MESAAGEHPRKNLVLAAMLFAVAMTFIDQTIVAIASPELQKDLSLTETGLQWIINGYLLSLSALFAFGGRLSDIVGHRTMVVIGVVVFATASGLCGATPEGSGAEAWIITFRVIQGAGAALMFPAALAIVLDAFPIAERGRAMAIFFAIAGGLTSIGPIAGGYLTEIDWRAIFWVNIPVAIIGLILVAVSKPPNRKSPAPLDYRGAVLISGAMGLSVLGLQQAASWGWSSPATWGCIVAGLLLLAAFVAYDRGRDNPLIRLEIFGSRAFSVDNAVLFVVSAVFVPLFFFASMYSQISLGDDASQAGIFLLTFFAGFALASQIGGRMLDQAGARRPVILGCAIGAVGFYLWGKEMTGLDYDDQWHWIVLSGAGMGLMFSPVNTDALNRAPRANYGEVTGITQTVRNYGSSLGLAVMGSLLVAQNKTNVEDSLSEFDIPKTEADRISDALTHGGGGDSGSFGDKAGQGTERIFEAVQLDFAMATRTVFYVMAGLMALAFVIALVGMPKGRVEDPSAGEPE